MKNCTNLQYIVQLITLIRFPVHSFHNAVKRFNGHNPEKNSPTVAHACRKRRLKWVLPQVGGWSTGLATLSL
jgi:hypothetical protein